jgi:hypothetical protein
LSSADRAPASGGGWTRARWILLGLATLYPGVYFVVFVLGMVLSVGADGQDQGDPDFGGSIAPFHVAAALVLLVLFPIYLVHVSRHQSSEGAKTRWTNMILFGSVVAMPVYWWTQMRPRGERETVAQERA